MSRGWESKDVESQQDQAEVKKRERGAKPPTPVELQRESLRLTRARVQADLERARHPRHREQLQAALAHLEAELAKIQ
jgi:hypothetical protein